MKSSTRLILAMVVLVALTATPVSWLVYRNIESVVAPRAFEHMKTHARLVAADLASQVRSVRADVLGFSAATALDGMVRARLHDGHPDDGTPEAVWRSRMAARYAAEMAVKSAYLRFRLIGVDDGGREIVSVDRAGAFGAIRIIADHELERQGEAHYVREALRLPVGEAHISPIVFHRSDEKGPPIPVLHVATPVHAPSGRPFAVVVVDLDLRPTLAAVRAAARPGVDLHVVDERGEYLVHPEPGREFGSAFGRSSLLQEEFPDLAFAPGAVGARGAWCATARARCSAPVSRRS